MIGVRERPHRLYDVHIIGHVQYVTSILLLWFGNGQIDPYRGSSSCRQPVKPNLGIAAIKKKIKQSPCSLPCSARPSPPPTLLLLVLGRCAKSHLITLPIGAGSGPPLTNCGGLDVDRRRGPFRITVPPGPPRFRTQAFASLAWALPFLEHGSNTVRVPTPLPVECVGARRS